MDKEQDLSTWFSTYGVLTAERILDKLGIHLEQEQLTSILHDETNVYWKILSIPIKNLFNGLILQQAHDYQVYAQKILIDYLLSGQDNTGDNVDAVREDLEALRRNLVETGEIFSQRELDHQKLIAESQASLMKFCSKMNKMLDPRTELEDIAPTYHQRSDDMGRELRRYRKEFYQLIVRATELLQTVPGYHLNETKQSENLSLLDFDAQIGEEIQDV